MEEQMRQLKEQVDRIEITLKNLYYADKLILPPRIEINPDFGTQIGIQTTDKIGFYGATPVDQPVTVSDPSIGGISGSDTVSESAISTNFTNIQTAVGAIIDRLQELGLIA